MAMTEFTSLCVSNFRSNFAFTNHSSSIPQAFDCDWLTPEFQFLANHKPKRLAFMVNFVLANWGQGNLYLGVGISRFNDAFAGTGFDPLIESTTCFEETLSMALFPATDLVLEESINRFCSFFLEVCGYDNLRERLGPALTRKLDFLAPFINENDGTAFLPDDLEPVSAEEEEWIDETMYERYVD
jgi:hypothetical protein